MWLLPNTAGDQASSIVAIGSTFSATGYDAHNLIAGPRSKSWRSTASSHGMALGYVLPANLSATHAVIARADKMVTLAGARLTFTQRSSANAWSGLSPVVNPLTAASLLGPKAQDYVTAISPAQLRGFGVDFDSRGNEAFEMSKMFFSAGFRFDGIIDLQALPEWNPIPPTQSVEMFTPQLGYNPYEVEASISILWSQCSRASIASFKALPQLLNWPLYLYDAAAALWSWKLEHVLVESWEEQPLNKDYANIRVNFKRLKHYE